MLPRMARAIETQRFHVIPAEQLAPLVPGITARPLCVYLPAAALEPSRRRFPVLYCQDGQNLWDDPHACFGHGGWYLNRIVDELTADNRLAPVILVGIANTEQRYREYTPGRSFNEIAAHPYANYVCDVIKPYIETRFPVRRGRQHTALLGSSLGGLVALWIAHHYPGLFGKAACLSGAFEPKDRQGQSFIDFLWERGRQDVQVYLDAGTVRDGAALTRKVRDTYRSLGWQEGRDLQHWEEPGAEHNERHWRHRVWRALTFLFPPG